MLHRGDAVVCGLLASLERYLAAVPHPGRIPSYRKANDEHGKDSGHD